MKRALLIVLALLSVTLLAALGGGLYLLNSADGLARVIAWSAAYLPGTLTVERVEGRLRGPLTIQGLEYRDETRQVRLGHLALSWNPEALFSRTLHIESLALRELHVAQTDDTAEDGAITVKVPLAVLIERLEAESLSLQTGDRAAQRLDRASLRARLEESTLWIDALKLDAPAGVLDATGRLDIVSPLRIDLETAWRFTLPDRSEWRGRGKVQGTAQRLTLAQTLQHPVAVTLAGAVDEPLAATRRWSARLTAAQLDLTSWIAGLPAPLTEVVLNLRGSGDRFEGEAGWIATLPELGATRLQTKLAGDPRQLRLTDLHLMPEALALRVNAEADIDLQAAPVTAAVKGHWEQLQWPLQGAAKIASAEGEFEWQGHASAYSWRLAAPLQLPDMTLGEWQLQGRGDRHGVQAEAIRGRIAGGEVSGRGELSWGADVRWQAQLRGVGLNPATYATEWPGQLDFSGTAVGGFGGAKTETKIRINDLSGTLRDTPVTGRAQFGVIQGGIRITQAEVQSGASRLTLEGQLAQQWDLAFRLNAEALNQWLPVTGGRANAEGRLRGSPAEPRLDARFQLAALRTGAASVATAEGTVAVNLVPGGAINTRLAAKGVKVAGQDFAGVTLTAEGVAERHSLRLAVTGVEGELELALRGGYRDRRWQGEVTEARGQALAVGEWSLAPPAAVSVSAEAASVATHCWRQASPLPTPVRLCGGGEWASSAGWRITGSAEQFPFDLLNRWLPGEVKIAGQVEGRYQLAQDAEGEVTGEARLSLGPGLVHPGRLDLEARSLAHRGGELLVSLREKRLSASLSLTPEAGGELTGQAALHSFDLRHPLAPQAELGGALRLRFPDLDLLAALLPRIAIGPGAMDLQLRLGGTLGAPELQGTALLEAQQVEIGNAGIRLRDVRLEGRSENGRDWQVNAGAESGGGTVRIEGSAELDPARGWPARFTVRGENFEVVNLRDYWALVSPDLTLVLEQDRVTVTGELRVPEAKIRPRRGGSEAVSVSRDAVIVGQETVEANPLLRAFYAKVRLILGDKVEFTGFGLSSRVSGELQIEDAPGSVVKGNGELRVVQGEYKSYGQNLEVESGRLTFAGGPIDNPGIDARAVRRSGDVTAGILLRGTLRNPQVTLFSTPTLPQADILSYLVLGVPVSQADQQSGGGSLLATAAALGYVADSPLVRQIRRGLGIEELRIESDTTTESVAVVLGRYLSPRLYVSYSVGLAESESAFRIRYKVGRNWTLETESGTNSGADLRYVIEK